MAPKDKEKEIAVVLRKQGKTYSEILREIPVAKSTLSLWLREVGLSKPQRQVISAKRRAAQLRGAAKRHTQRIEGTAEIQTAALKEVGKLSRRELLLIGASLYWAEGSKAKAWRPSVGVQFSNSDPYMVAVFIRWLQEICGIMIGDIRFSLYIHKNHASRLEEVKRFWITHTGMPEEQLTYVYFKKHNPKTKRRKIDNTTYYGLIALRVPRSTNLNRRIEGWVQGICRNYCRVV